MIQSFEVANIRCGGCANTITKALNEAGFKEVNVDLSCEPRKVTAVIENEASSAHLIAVLRSLGYPLIEHDSGLKQNTFLKAKSFVSCVLGKIN